MKKRITVKDLAELAGVDHSTVSRALNDSPRVKAETKRRIQELALQHNFSFDSNARSLSSRRTGVIGIIYPAGMEDFNSSLYTGRLFMDIRKELERLHLDGILLESQHPVTGTSNVARLISENKVDGFLILHSGIAKSDYEHTARWNIPLVQVHLRPYEYPVEQLDFFCTDNRTGGRLAGEHLFSLDCENFHDVSITCCSDIRKGEALKDTDQSFATETEERSLGFGEWLRGAGVNDARILSYDLDGSFQAGRNFILSERKNLKKGDGIFFHSDLLAFGALSVCRELGIAVPEDLKIMGFDDSPIALLSDGGITTVHQPRELISRLAAERIRKLLDARYSGAAGRAGPDGSSERVQELIAPGLVIRKSTVDKGESI